MIEWVDILLYKCSVVFIVDATEEDWAKFFETHKKELTEKDNINVIEAYNEKRSLGFCLQTDGGDYVCHISDKDNIGLVAHEIFHVANMLLSDKGYTADYLGEPTAYLIEFLINEFYKLFK